MRSRLILPQFAIGLGVIALAIIMAWGASYIKGEAGYARVGPSFLPWVVAGGLALCGALLCFQAATGGFRQAEEAPAQPAQWQKAAWVSAGLLAAAALFTTAGFVFSCALLFMLAARGFTPSESVSRPQAAWFANQFGLGVTVAAPVYWLFTKALGLTLPGLTGTGWI
jgi:putative tricarboxylic transport membrane protein